MLGPIDYIAIGFNGDNFDGSILGEITKAVSDGTIRVIDLVFVQKEQSGDVLVGELSDQSEDVKRAFDPLSIPDDMPLFTDGDTEKIAELLENGTAAGILVIEHLWAVGLKKALLDAGGFVLAEGRIRPDDVEADVAELNETKA